jgi:hypothetical protein
MSWGEAVAGVVDAIQPVSPRLYFGDHLLMDARGIHDIQSRHFLVQSCISRVKSRRLLWQVSSIVVGLPKSMVALFFAAHLVHRRLFFPVPRCGF